MTNELKPPPRFHLATTPTPLEAFMLSPAPESGVEIFIKRDDLTGSELSGNKIRKLEFIFYDAVSKKSDVIITCGGVQSNHCRATAALAARIGLECELVLKGRKPAVPNGNLLLDNLFRANIRYVTESEYEKNIDSILERRARELAARGRKPYVIPEGASNPLGLWGYILAGQELKQQLDRAGISADYIVCAVGSGGTYAGLLLAALHLKWPIKILGMAVCRSASYFRTKISKLMSLFRETYSFDLRFDPSMIRIDDSYIGPGYARISKKEADFIRNLAANSGILLDPAYTSKAMIGLFDLIKRGEIPRNSKVVFIHTGGLLSVFAYRDKLIAN